MIEHYFKWVLMPTWKYWYEINKAFEDGSQWEKTLKNEIEILQAYVERTEKERDTLNIITLKQQEYIRELRSELYVLVNRFGIFEEVLAKGGSWNWFRDYLDSITAFKAAEQEARKDSRSSQEEGQDTTETPGN